MDKETNRIAVASSDGIVVNSHFGRARKFYIYEQKSDELRLEEVREVEPVCEGGNHDAGKLQENMELLSDCRYLLVSRIGYEAAAVAAQFEIEPYEIPGLIPDAVEQLTKFVKVKELFQF